MASKSNKLVVTNPYDQQALAEFNYDSQESLSNKVEQARAAQHTWRKKGLDERIAILQTGLERLRAAEEQVVRDVTMQMGKPITQSRSELSTLFDRAEHSMALAPSALAPDELPPRDGFVRRIEHEPLGVVLNMAAWNYPLIIPINVMIPALLAGNTVILKHSGKTPLSGVALEQAFGKLDVPHLVINVILSHETTAALIENGGIDHVSFTGSVSGGKTVYRSAASRLLGAGLELGGNDPAYVAADADLDFCVDNIIDGACYNAGQSCCAVERVYVHRDLYDAFLDKACSAMEQYQLGDPLQEATTMGPLASQASVALLERHVDDAVAKGAKLLCGGKRSPEFNGNFFEPTVLGDCPQESLVMQEESFGPLLPVKSVAHDDEAIRWMNGSRFGLTASVWTRDMDRAERCGRELEAGTVFQNRCDYLDPALPWTGWKESGLGSTLSRYGFHHLTQRKSIHFRKTP